MKFPRFGKFILSLLCLAAAVIGLTGCGELLEKPQSEPFYGQVTPPPAQEFRWSNGNLPKTFDPAFASAAPDTDVVRAIYEGLTDWDTKTLQAVPAVAAQWEASTDFRTWTFYLRANARWENGKAVVAQDFVRSWRRVVELGEKSPNFKLFSNIVGTKLIQNSAPKVQSQPESQNLKNENQKTEAEAQNQNPRIEVQKQETWFGVEAASNSVLRVWLVEPDKDFPKLVAHPAFRPVGDSGDWENPAKIVSNGAFRLISPDKNSIVLERSKNYWNASNVSLERVRFVPAKDAEAALAAYQAGEVDAVTNASFEPLAVKLLASYEDFRRTPFSAVTFYEFNSANPQFADRRVRQALALAIDRERITQDEMDGAGIPANAFLPQSPGESFKYNPEKAKKLLAAAGYENGKNFQKIRLLINRNDLQRRIAKAVAAMWLKNLGLETEIVVSSFEELGTAVANGDFDLVRRGVVLPTTNESVNLQTIFKGKEKTQRQNAPVENQTPPLILADATPKPSPTPLGLPEPINLPPKIFEESESAAAQPEAAPGESNQADTLTGDAELVTFLTEAEVVEEIPAIPLYFPSSYALVKPYVSGFEPNMLDAPSLKDVQIKTDWKR